jgi:light-regulated signal transduction histidine kinase (bacteriophytochrome)
VERAFAGEKVLVTRELNFGPMRIWVDVQYLPVTDSEGRVNSVAFVALDITARKQSELELQELNTRLEKRVEERTARLQQLNGELESFSYSVSHDLAAPLRIISGFSRALLEDYADSLDTEGKEHLLTICSSTQRMKQIMDDLLMLSRVTRREIRRETVNLSRMAAEVAGLLEKEHPGRKAEVIIDPDLRAEADTGLVRILLDNLLENAWKYSEKREVIRVEVGKTMTQQGMAFFVKDNGAGFDMKYAGKLFDAFQRLHSGRDFPGTGVGLATVQRIVTRHGGQIWAWSEPDKGAVFYFTLPESSPAT